VAIYSPFMLQHDATDEESPLLFFIYSNFGCRVDSWNKVSYFIYAGQVSLELRFSSLIFMINSFQGSGLWKSSIKTKRLALRKKYWPIRFAREL